MPKRTDLKSILILGAGPIVIGQACEFDYSGAQACKALREEGYRVILVNSNPATIMTDPSMADATYIEPIEWQTVARIIEEEKPDALLPTMGGQTALNCALDLAREGVLETLGVEMIGATKEAIDKAEDRQLFDQAMKRIGLETPRASTAHLRRLLLVEPPRLSSTPTSCPIWFTTSSRPEPPMRAHREGELVQARQLSAPPDAGVVKATDQEVRGDERGHELVLQVQVPQARRLWSDAGLSPGKHCAVLRDCR